MSAMNSYDKGMELWAHIRGLAGCTGQQQDWEALEECAVADAVERLAENGGVPGWMTKEVEELAGDAVGGGIGANTRVGILREAFEELERERFKEFVDKCCERWLETSRKVMEFIEEENEEDAQEDEEFIGDY